MNSVDLGRCKRIVQYLWDPEPKNDEEPSSPIWCLGKEYNRHVPVTTSKGDTRPQMVAFEEDGHDPEDLAQDATTQTHETALGWPKAFVRDFESRIWITYRSNFVPIPRPQDHDANPNMTLSVRLRSQLMDSQGFTSDTGWGCMIRSGQSLLANGLSSLLLGRDWQRGSKADEEIRLLSLFADFPDAPFSIHRFVELGAERCGKYPGEWFGPSATALCIQALCEQCQEPKLRVYVSNENANVYQHKFMEIARDDAGYIRPTLILLGTRLGIDHITPVYWDALKAALQYPQSVGIAGGRPSASHYFVGVQGSHLFYLDPHHTRPALPYRPAHELYSEEERDTYHTRRLRRIHIKDMDPSMLLGFLIKNEEDWEDWKKRVEAGRGKPIIHILGDMQPDYGLGREEALDEVEALDDIDGMVS
ncbi:cysteine protease ATG4 [Aspergillus chevalieri]|uniref:Cysteine protease n=1 Tax=Aspergillus chevalieri TaxID=182096 RepID=A0A7R7ZSE0_ASPCH|nr:cysteine protease atg4 [Aspergillus chevalieri]BCR91716.1 cysteine protease atg4 [Aspergillus chevalieri]